MDIFFKAVGGILITVILILAVGKQEKGIAVVLSIAACCMIAIVTMTCLRPIIDMLFRLDAIGNLQENGLGILLKIVGIGFVAEIASMVCQDTGNASLGRELQILASAVILNLSLPFFESLVDIIQMILGEL